MTNYEYASWVRGYLQLCPDASINARVLHILKNHLNLVIGVEGGLGEHNKRVFERIVDLLEGESTLEDYARFKQLLVESYFDSPSTDRAQ